MSILQLAPVLDTSKAEALSVLDELRAAVEMGDVICFAAVSISDGDDLHTWTAATKRCSRLRTMGAVSHLLACLHSGDA